ncbi:hypothetical protein DFH08DRAFT_814615 [Mycena albidolilacea]|uniref:Uncharacterized protein n=1 Tax=Mycena albidolilacea TaxID=1033008 RepID=A0AAD7EK90_9AGAR|nr:hypothetical protein DFH08DRAFT_814615 [Mycena albidolilacea]
MGTISAIAGCGGPTIPFRGGQIDMTEAGPETVSGLNATEMIGLVVCGHSLVIKTNFPLIVTKDEPTSIKTFASTIGFDNMIDDNVTMQQTYRALNFKVTNTLLFPQGRCSVGSFQVNTASVSLLATLQGIATFKSYRFNAAVDLAISISHFWFEVNNNGSEPIVVDNHSANYVIDQDILMFNAWCTSATQAGLTFVMAVKDPLGMATVAMTTTVARSLEIPVTSTVTTGFQFNFAVHLLADRYTFYSAAITNKDLSNTIHVNVDGTVYEGIARVWVTCASSRVDP